MKAKSETTAMLTALSNWAESQDIPPPEFAYICAVMAGRITGLGCKGEVEMKLAVAIMSEIMSENAEHAAKNRDKVKL